MDLVVKGRGAKVSASAKERMERKLQHLLRLDAGIQRVEVELIEQPSPRVDGGYRIEAAAHASRRTFRAHGTGSDADAAFEQVVDRLERQIGDDHKRRRARLIGGGNRLKSGRFSQMGEPSTPTPEP